jgi:hypothetical protein
MPRYLIHTYQTTRRHVPQDHNVNNHHLVTLYLIQILSAVLYECEAAAAAAAGQQISHL